MKFISKIAAAILFILFLGFALKNTQEEVLRFFFDYEVRGPLVLILLCFFVTGAVLGVLAMLPTVFRYRREVSKHKKTILGMQKANEVQQLANLQPPQPDSVMENSHK